MTERRKGLGRGLGALIPSAPVGGPERRPADVFFGDHSAVAVADRVEPVPERAERVEPVLERAERVEPVPERAEPVATQDAVPEPTSSAELPVEPQPAVAHDVDESTSDTGLVPVDATFAEIPIDSIRPNPMQPRTVFDEDDLAELADSITQVGVLQPVVVRPIGDGFELVMGERRWRASRRAGLSVVPAIVRTTADDDLLRDALLENLHRSQLNPLEEAAAYDQLLKDFGCGHEELATRIGRSRPQISNTLRLLKLPPIVQRRVAAGVLSAGHARALLGLNDHAKMERLAQRIVAEGLSVRATEEIVALGGDEDESRPRRAARTSEPNERLDSMAARLGDRLDTRVKIAMTARRGRLTVEFAGVDDLERIVALLAPEAGVSAR